MQLIDGRKIKNEILEEVKQSVAALPFVPVFCDVLVGDDQVSKQYIDMKAKTAEAVGIKFHRAQFPNEITTEKLVEEIKKLDQIQNICGLIIQLPLPGHILLDPVLDAIDPSIDVDCLSSVAREKFYAGDPTLGYPTALACMHIIDSLGVDLKNRHIVVVGQGLLVGSPVTALLRARGFDVSTITLKTENTSELLKDADLIISATGQGKYLTGDMIKQGAIVIDAGTSESDSGIVGDVDLASVRDVASHVSPVPGGVGPVTVAMLLKNVLAVAHNK